MRIVIDLQGAQSDSRFRGIGRYSLSLAQAMARNAGEHEIWLVLNGQLADSLSDIRAAFAGLIDPQRIRVFTVPEVASASPWSVRAAEVLRESFLATLYPDVVLVSSLFEGYMSNAVTSIGAVPTHYPTATVLYDLIPLLNKEVYLGTSELQAYYQCKIDWLKNADILLAISDSSRQEAIENLSIDPQRIANISAAIGEQFKADDDQARGAERLQRLGIKAPFILYAPGGFDPRKNFARLLEAYSRLSDELKSRYPLVIASKLHPPQRAELQALAEKFAIRPSELVLTGYVNDQDLIGLYSQATLFVFPSVHEGFGLPVLEAMACGAAVIGSNSSSVPEVIGCAEALFDPLSVESIAAKLTQSLEDEAFRQRLIDSARQHCTNFSWDASAQKAIAALEQRHQPRPTEPQEPRDIPPSELLQRLVALTDTTPSDIELFHVAKSIAFNFAEKGQRQLLLDVSSIVQSDAKSGIQRVVRSLLHEFLSAPPDGLNVRPVYYAEGRYYYANAYTARVHPSFPETEDALIDFAQDDIYLSLDLNMHLANQLYPLHHQMRLMGVQISYIVYDLLLHHRPDWWPHPTGDMFNDWLHKIALAGSNLICISAAVANELQTWLDQHPELYVGNQPRVSSFHLGADIDNSLPSAGLPDDAPQLLDLLRHQPSFLMVSTIEPRKGHAQALSAFETLWAQGHEITLVIIGKRGWLVDALVARLDAHPEKGKRLFWLEGISDEYLEKVYSAATCLIAASEGEGFGLPLIEAAQHHMPMIIRDLPVFREIAGEHAFYFSGLNSADLSAAVVAWLALYQAGEHPASSAMPWLTWEQSAEQLKAQLA